MMVAMAEMETNRTAMVTVGTMSATVTAAAVAVAAAAAAAVLAAITTTIMAMAVVEGTDNCCH